MRSKTSTYKENFYLPILNSLKTTTNLSQIQKELSISKQQLNFYLRQLLKKQLIIKKSRGYYEVVKDSKNQLMYGNLLSKDSIRGHGYIWTIKLPKEIKDWDKRAEKLKENGIHFNLVGIQKNIPRIKILGRKVWLCNNHLRIFDKKDNSYYGENAKESRYSALNEVSLIVGALNKKLGLSISSLDIQFNKEHYALIKNDLAIEHNKKGEQLHIKDKFGEWLLIDDSMGEGGELENIGKDAFKTNIPMQKWWNNQKDTGFKVTPDFILKSINQVTQNQLMFAKNIDKHMEVLQGIENAIRELRKEIKNGSK